MSLHHTIELTQMDNVFVALPNISRSSTAASLPKSGKKNSRLIL